MSQWASSDHRWKSKRDLAIAKDREQLRAYIAELEKHQYGAEVVEAWTAVLRKVGGKDYEPGDYLKWKPVTPSDQLKAVATAVQNGEGSAHTLAQMVLDYLSGALKPQVAEG